MAHALRKLLRHSSDHDGDKSQDNGGGGGGGGGGSGSPSEAARRLLSRACSSVHACRDASKVCPADKTVPNAAGNINSIPNAMNTATHLPLPKKGGGIGGGALSRASSFFRSKKNHMMNESTLQHSKLVRTRRLMKEFQEMCKQQRELESPVFTVELVEDNLFEWNVKLHKVDPESELYRDMQETSTPYVLLNLTFPDNFPFAPPFMRVIAPRIEKGFVMEGGAICMELLTPRGWASAYTVEAVIMQFAASLVKGQGRIARKVKGNKEFNKGSAEASFRSLVKTHEKYGWVTPPLSDG